MKEYSIAIIFSNIVKLEKNKKIKNINNNFFYLTGINVKNYCALLIIKYNKKNKSIFFYNTQNNIKILQSKLFINNYFPLNNIYNILFQKLLKTKIIYFSSNCYYSNNILLKITKKINFSYKIIDLNNIIHEMRLFKSKEEIKKIKISCKISAYAHKKTIQHCKTNIYEYHLSNIIENELKNKGAEKLSFPTIVGSGKNGCTLHYNKNNKLMLDGELVLLDAGGTYKGYASDITRTFPVNGKFSEQQKEIYNIVYTCLKKALKLYKPGTSIYSVTKKIIKIKVQKLLFLGLLHGNINEIIQKKLYFPFFMHSLSHWLGIDVHDVGDYGKEKKRKLLPGMVLTVEPGIYIPADISNVPTKYKGIGIRIEDTILITSEGNKNLTSSVTSDINKIEILMSKKK